MNISGYFNIHPELGKRSFQLIASIISVDGVAEV